MPRRLSGEEWAGVFRETDEFRLAIRGAAGIEAEVDAAIAEGFEGSLPAELRPGRARFELRLAVLVGLGVIQEDEAAMIRKLSWVRNKFAHGNIDALTPEMARELVVAARAIGPTPPTEDWLAGEHNLAASPLYLSLATLLIACHIIVTQNAERARRRREEERTIVERHRSQERMNNRAAILALLTQEGSNRGAVE
jgi:hypothetical protein